MFESGSKSQSISYIVLFTVYWQGGGTRGQQRTHEYWHNALINDLFIREPNEAHYCLLAGLWLVSRASSGLWLVNTDQQKKSLNGFYFPSSVNWPKIRWVGEMYTLFSFLQKSYCKRKERKSFWKSDTIKMWRCTVASLYSVHNKIESTQFLLCVEDNGREILKLSHKTEPGDCGEQY